MNINELAVIRRVDKRVLLMRPSTYEMPIHPEQLYSVGYTLQFWHDLIESRGKRVSLKTNAPAMFDIIAGKNSEAWIIDGTILPKLFEEDIEAGRQGRLFMQSTYVSLAKRYCALYAKTARERYLDLIHDHPQIEQDVPQKEIAEYFQIDPITLCRIKKALLKQ